jgi:hypothetical protein
MELGKLKRKKMDKMLLQLQFFCRLRRSFFFISSRIYLHLKPWRARISITRGKNSSNRDQWPSRSAIDAAFVRGNESTR